MTNLVSRLHKNPEALFDMNEHVTSTLNTAIKCSIMCSTYDTKLRNWFLI